MTTERETLTANDRYEMIAAAYFRATGKIAPGKDDPLRPDMSEEERRREFDLFNAFASGWQAATPPAEGPVVTIRCESTGEITLLETGSLSPAALGLAPGECKRVRLTVEGIDGV